MTNEELERSVERLNRAVKRLSDLDPVNDRDGEPIGHLVDIDDVELLLSERAELLATVERMRGLLEQMADLLQIANRSTDRPSGYVSRIVIAARAALTTGEEK